MSVDEIKNAMINDGNDIYFVHNGRESGVSTTVMNSVFIFHAWFGAVTKDFKGFDEMIHDRFFGGKSIVDLVNTVDIYIC